MNKTSRFLGVACGLGLLASLPVHAQDSAIKMNGFASAGFITGDMDVDFYSGTDIISEAATFGADNTIGLQLSADVSKDISFTGQLLAKGVVDGYNLESHWAFVDYHPQNDFSLRAGRLVLPLMMNSEYVDVGYAYPWIRPPMEVYSGVPMTSYSGVDILYTVSFDNSDLVLQPIIGSVPLSSSVGLNVEAQLGFGLNTSLQLEYGSIRAGLVKVSGLEGSDSSGAFQFNADATIVALGADIEVANIVLMTEYLKKDFDFSGLPGFTELEGEAWYVTLGYRMGKFLPHITFADSDMDQDQLPALDVVLNQILTDNPAIGAFLGTLPPEQQQAFMADPLTSLSDPTVQAALVGLGVTLDPAQLQTLPALANMQLPPAPMGYKQQSITLGLRYEFLPRTSLKIEYQEIEPKEESWGLFVQDPGDKVRLASFAIDVTF